MDRESTYAAPGNGRSLMPTRGDRAGLIDEATHEIRNATSELQEIGAQLREHLDMTLGPVPQPGASSGQAVGDTPIRADQLRQSVGYLRHTIAGLREQVMRVRDI